MSQYLVLSQIDVQNANSIAGLTWGYPAITHFLGFTHALSRKLSLNYKGDYDTELTGCAVISHLLQNKVYQPKPLADFEFLQSKNPPVLAKHKNGSPPIIEEGKLNLTVSLIIEIAKSLTLTTEQIHSFEHKVMEMCYGMRLAGGTILNIKQIKLLSASTESQHEDMLRKIKRLTMPGFVLLDRSNYLNEHYQTLLDTHEQNGGNPSPQLLDAWLDFSALKYKANPHLKDGKTEPDHSTLADWVYVKKPKPGYLVPLMTGYKAISELYEAGDVSNTRDEVTPSRFVEAVHSIGEWKGMHSVKSLPEVIWRYQNDGQWYLCKQNLNSESTTATDLVTDSKQLLNLTEALNLF